MLLKLDLKKLDHTSLGYLDNLEICFKNYSSGLRGAMMIIMTAPIPHESISTTLESITVLVRRFLLAQYAIFKLLYIHMLELLP